MQTLKHEAEWLPLFPYEKPRAEQADAIDRAISAIRAGTTFIIMDLPTGVGKSAVGITLASWAAKYLRSNESTHPGGTFLTTQKVLQDQYMDDFSNVGLTNLKAASNYSCTFSPEESCKEARHLMHLKGDTPKKKEHYSAWRRNCSGDCPGCVYVQAREAFRHANLGVTSFAYFLHGRAMMTRRNLLIIDEAHNIEGQLMSFVEFRVTRAFAEGMLGLRWPTEFEEIHEDSPKAAAARDSFRNWLNEKYHPAITIEASKAAETIKNLGNLPGDSARELIRNAERIVDAKRQIDQFLKEYNESDINWVAQIETNLRKGKKQNEKTLVYKTVDVAPHAQKYLYSKGAHVICMSATILNPVAFAESVGIPKDDYVAISHDSPFPVENRMVYMQGCGSMTRKDKDETLPRMVEEIEKLLTEFDGKKGIIHTHTYANAQFLRDNISNKYAKRLLFHDSSDRDEILEFHKETKKDTVLVSPSMAEGVDLKDDLSRFQIIMKVPYPYLGDPLIQRKNELSNTWYGYQTVKIVCQMIGRSVRSQEDTAETFILDSNFGNFYRRSKKLFPSWFRDAYTIA